MSSAVPAVMSAGGNGAVYHTTITNGTVQLFRRTIIPLVFVDVASGESHVFRVELHGSLSYAWYIDSAPVESGVPLSSYPDPTAILIWGVRRSYVDATTRWDYVRYGVIPVDGSGDFDSSDSVDLFDYYFAHECLTNKRPGINGGPGKDAGPGCRFTDFDFDGDGAVDLRDAAHFMNCFTGPAPAACFDGCEVFDFTQDDAIDVDDTPGLVGGIGGP